MGYSPGRDPRPERRGESLASKGIRYRQDSDWHTGTKVVDAPEGAVAFNVSVSFRGSQGIWDIRVLSNVDGAAPKTQTQPESKSQPTKDDGASSMQKSLLPAPLRETIYQRDRIEPQPIVGAQVKDLEFTVTIHVAPDGADTAAGTTKQPLRTIVEAAKRARTELDAG